MLVLENAPIVMSTESFFDLLFGVFVVYLKPPFKGIVILRAFLFVLETRMCSAVTRPPFSVNMLSIAILPSPSLPKE